MMFSEKVFNELNSITQNISELRDIMYDNFSAKEPSTEEPEKFITRKLTNTEEIVQILKEHYPCTHSDKSEDCNCEYRYYSVRERLRTVI